MTDAAAELDWTKWNTRYLFFTGKGGVGKTTVASTLSVQLADAGKRVLLVSTDPASNLDDVFGREVGQSPIDAPGVSGLSLMNIDPEAAAEEYRERVVGPYREILPEDELRGLEEQLSGACTVEIAAFDEFTQLVAQPTLVERYDHVVFDTAPTGHTLRLMNLPSAWSSYLAGSPQGASCLGPLTGLNENQQRYSTTVDSLSDPAQTTLILVSRPELTAIREAARASKELEHLGIRNQHLVLNGVLSGFAQDDVGDAILSRQRLAMDAMPEALRQMSRTTIPVVPGDLRGVDALRELAKGDWSQTDSAGSGVGSELNEDGEQFEGLTTLIDSLEEWGPGAVMLMGKGGVGKTTMAAAVAVALAKRGHQVHLTTTDPAAHLRDALAGEVPENLELAHIDPATELEKYKADVIRRAGDIDDEQRALLEEDLRSPCTEEIAVFRAFSRTLSMARKKFVVLDTAPTGHTLLLLDTTGAYHQEITRNAGETSGRMITPLMRLQDPAYTRVLLVSLAEGTPVMEAERLQQDLRRAGIDPYGWIINQTYHQSGTRHPTLVARARMEQSEMKRVQSELAHRLWVVPWQPGIPAGETELSALAAGSRR